MNLELRNKTPEEVQQTLAKTPRRTLVRMIYRLLTLEPHFSVQEFAQARGLKRDTVLSLIREKKIRPVHVPTDRGDYRIPLSAAEDFDRRTAIS